MTAPDQAPPADYRGTVRVPRTDFPMKANLAQLEPRLLERWEKQALAHRILERNAGRPLFVLHDGPPYANGFIHHGHILNKTLKDIVVKYRNMAGFLAHLVPGWDCHGLPIELNVDRALSADEKARLGKADVRALCRKEAEKWIDVQRRQFKRLGVMASWAEPYLTMAPAYEAAVIRQLACFADGNGLYKDVKPVHWCWSCQTALAEAEVEHRLLHSPSLYVAFPVTDAATRTALNPELASSDVAVLVWTTTPWTLPANRAVAVGPESFGYQAFAVAGRKQRLIVAAPLKAAVEAALGLALSDGKPVDMHAVSSTDGSATLGVDHPFLVVNAKPLRVPIITADHVTLELGTGLVHTAPGHGPEDFVVGQRVGLEIANPVGDDGRYTAQVGVEGWQGKHVLKDGNTAVVELLTARGALPGGPPSTVEHEFPHCWRCKNPVIFRATEQWFISMETRDLRQRALEALEQVHWVPAWGKDRMGGMLTARPDWCISRQRVWGVPIPAFVCAGCGVSHATRDSFEHVARIFETHGADAWWTLPVEKLTPPGLACSACKGTSWRKEENIVDVWFESGASFAAVLQPGIYKDLQQPADLYLEGSDQHRGWFHSTLLVGIGAQDAVPYRTVLTHGFVVDGSGHKYSKSSPNFVPPEQVLDEHGAELLRLWVAATDYSGDLRISPEILSRLTEGYRKFRNTLRFMLGNLGAGDFDPNLDTVPRDRMAVLDRYILARFSALIGRVVKGYEEYHFHLVVQALNEFVGGELSSFYIDVQKDTLYCDKLDAPRRRSAQTALYTMARGLMTLMAPILSFSAEEAWDFLPDDGSKETSVHLSRMPMRLDGYDREDTPQVLNVFERLLKVRVEVQKALEPFRAEGHNSLEACVSLSCAFELRDFLSGFQDELPGLFLVSQVELLEQVKGAGFTDAAAIQGLRIRVAPAQGHKCARCWTYSANVGKNASHPLLCPRCADVVGGTAP